MKDGAEIDFVIERDGAVVPVKAKWTARTTPRDARHLRMFLKENRVAPMGY